MRIIEVQVKNYKSIRDSGNIPITKLFALIGKNNTGKSALVDGIQAFWGLKGKEVKESDFHKGSTTDVEVIVRFRNDSDNAAAEKFQDANDELTIAYRCLKETLKGEYTIGAKKVAAKEVISMLPKLMVIPAIRNPQNETTAGAKSYLKELTSSLLSLVPDGRVKVKDIENIPAKDLTIEQINLLLESKTKTRLAEVSRVFTGHFQSAIVDDSVSLEIDPEGDLSKAVSFATNMLDAHLGPELEKVNILSCGTGLQSMAILALLQTYADMEKHETLILVVEEPEVYLHPELQRKMFGALRKIAKDTQVLYTTHSPIMISELWADESVRLVKRRDGESAITPIDIASVISELGIRYDDVLNPQAIVFVEGDQDVICFNAIAEALQPGRLGRRIKFIASDGFRNIHAFALMKILSSENVQCNVFAIADGDGEDKDRRQDALYKQITQKISEIEKHLPKDRISILTQHEIESYFVTAPMLSKLLPSVGKKEMEAFVTLYKKKYEAAHAEYQKSRLAADLLSLAQLYRPSLLMSRLKNAKQIERIKAAYDNDDAFMAIRDQLAEAWRQKERQTGKSALSYLLDGVDVKKAPNLLELITAVDGIIKQSEKGPVPASKKAVKA